MKKLEPGNIWSGSKTLAVFTNPTELAFKKGNLRFHYPVVIDEQEFEDCEAAYHHFTKDCKGELAQCMVVCVEIIKTKFKQYPNILEAIKDSGGLAWIKKCSHFTFGRTKNFKRWEGQGLESPYIRCLYEAYAATNNTARVVHCKREPYDVYIGRPSKWGNPFLIGKDGTREEVTEKYRQFILKHPQLIEDLYELKGKVLGCWCAPNSCHGDVLIELMTTYDKTYDR